MCCGCVEKKINESINKQQPAKVAHIKHNVIGWYIVLCIISLTYFVCGLVYMIVVMVNHGK